MILVYVILGTGILLGVIGQMLLKSGASAESLLGQLFSPHSIVGLTFYFGAAMCYMFALRKLPVSVAFPAVSLSYVLVALLAYWMFDEPLGWAKLVGIALICTGVVLVVRQA